MLRSSMGFTLMEVLVVVTIIGILAAIAVPSYINAVEQGRREACATNVQILYAQVERYRLTVGKPVPEDADLVHFLKEKGYLAGEELKCPFESEEVKPQYKLKYEGQDAIVNCTHCNPEQ